MPLALISQLLIMGVISILERFLCAVFLLRFERWSSRSSRVRRTVVVAVVLKQGSDAAGRQNAPIGAALGRVVDHVTPALVEKVEKT